MENELPVYRYLVRPHGGYCIHVWGPYYPKDFDNFETIQRSANTMVEELKCLEYREYNEGLATHTGSAENKG